MITIMGWMRTLLLGDIGNRLDIADTESDIDQLRQSQSRSTRELEKKNRTIETLQEELEQQKLALTALTRFLIDRQLIELEELDEYISEIDAEDGVIDGKLALDPKTKRLKIVPRSEIPEGTFRRTSDPENLA
jgi:chromosome segregation ATPase